METSVTRAAITEEVLLNWFRRVEVHVMSKPGMAEANLDPRRKFWVVSLLNFINLEFSSFRMRLVLPLVTPRVRC